MLALWQRRANWDGGMIGFLNFQGLRGLLSYGQTPQLSCAIPSHFCSENYPFKEQGSSPPPCSARFFHLLGFSPEVWLWGNWRVPPVLILSPRSPLSPAVRLNVSLNGKHNPGKISQIYKSVTRKATVHLLCSGYLTSKWIENKCCLESFEASCHEIKWYFLFFCLHFPYYSLPMDSKHHHNCIECGLK